MDNKNKSNALTHLSILCPKEFSEKDTITSVELHDVYHRVRTGSLSQQQVIASMEVCTGDSKLITSNEIEVVFQEMDRRYFLMKDFQWEFALLDTENTGCISVEKARFLFQAAHGYLFSSRKWREFLQSRPSPDAPVSLDEIEVDLCTLPDPDDWDVTDLDQSRSKDFIDLTQTTQDNDGTFVDIKPKKTRSSVSSHRGALSSHRGSLSSQSGVNENDTTAEGSNGNDNDLNAKSSTIQENTDKTKDEIVIALENAISSSDVKLLEAALAKYNSSHLPTSDDQYAQSVALQAEELLELLQCKKAINEAIEVRTIPVIDHAFTCLGKCKFKRTKEILQADIDRCSQLAERLRRLARLRKEVLELKQSTIAELRSYKKPLPAIHNVMIATYLLLGTPEKTTKKWINVQSLLGKTGKEGLKRRILQCDIDDVTLESSRRARSVVGETDLETVRDLSAGAATFFVWMENMIEEVIDRNQG